MRRDFNFSLENSFSLLWINFFKLTYSLFLSFFRFIHTMIVTISIKRNLIWSKTFLPSMKESFSFKSSLLLLRCFLALICLPKSTKGISHSLYIFRKYSLTPAALLFNSSLRGILPKMVIFSYQMSSFWLNRI